MFSQLQKGVFSVSADLFCFCNRSQKKEASNSSVSDAVNNSVNTLADIELPHGYIFFPWFEKSRFDVSFFPPRALNLLP